MVVIHILQTVLLIFILYVLVSQSGKQLPMLKNRAQYRKIVLDACTLIDGRIAVLVKLGFLHDEIIIPKIVLQELQMLADGKDALKRERARHGLDIATVLQKTSVLTVTIDETDLQNNVTDEALLELSKKTSAYLCTTDFNLLQRAKAQNLSVLNINELAKEIRVSVLPGETKKVKITQKGSNQKQGVAYLEDGTLVVVENGQKYLGEQVQIRITKVRQTESGRMLFGEVSRTKSAEPKPEPAVPARSELAKTKEKSAGNDIQANANSQIITRFKKNRNTS